MSLLCAHKRSHRELLQPVGNHFHTLTSAHPRGKAVVLPGDVERSNLRRVRVLQVSIQCRVMAKPRGESPLPSAKGRGVGARDHAPRPRGDGVNASVALTVEAPG